MATVSWTDPKDWLNVTKVTADNFNEQIADNFRWLFEKNIAVALRAGIADLTNVNTTAPTVSVHDTVFELQLEKEADTSILMTFSGNVSNSLNLGKTRFDILVDNSYFVSSGTATPLSEGLWFQQFPTAARVVSMQAQRFIANVPDGLHNFKLVWWVSSGTGSINLTNGSCQYSVEEYGVPDYQ